MKLAWFEPKLLGPFRGGEEHGTRVWIDPKVTVITGANDVGKTLLLRVIESALVYKALPQPDHNTALPLHGGEATGEPSCWFCIKAEAGDKGSGLIAGDCEPGDEVVFEATNSSNFAPVYRITQREGQQKSPKSNPSLPKRPQVLHLTTGQDIGNIIDVAKPNPAEQRFLTRLFGSGAPLNLYATLADASARTARLEKAEGRLNGALQDLLPKGMNLRFHLSADPQNLQQLQITVSDELDVYVPLRQRGAGVRKMITLLGNLATMSAEVPTLILADEPETSLHADAQHSLRRLLEKLAEKPNVQVIYATHSPSMINNMRPQSVRVIERTGRGGAEPSSIVVNQAFGESFYLVRVSLGLTPADSLLFATVSIVVEGETELTSLQLLLARLEEGGVDGFSDVKSLLENCHILNGNGSEFPRMCKLAISQRSAVVGLVDGDKSGDQAKKEAEKSGASVVQLPRGCDIESIFAEDQYVEAANEWLREQGVDCQSNGTEYGDFLKANPNSGTRPLTARIKDWTRESFGIHFSKPEVFQIALKRAEIAALKGSPVVTTLRELVEKVRQGVDATE